MTISLNQVLRVNVTETPFLQLSWSKGGNGNNSMILVLPDCTAKASEGNCTGFTVPGIGVSMAAYNLSTIGKGVLYLKISNSDNEAGQQTLYTVLVSSNMTACPAWCTWGTCACGLDGVPVCARGLLQDGTAPGCNQLNGFVVQKLQSQGASLTLNLSTSLANFSLNTPIIAVPVMSGKFIQIVVDADAALVVYGNARLPNYAFVPTYGNSFAAPTVQHNNIYCNNDAAGDEDDVVIIQIIPQVWCFNTSCSNYTVTINTTDVTNTSSTEFPLMAYNKQTNITLGKNGTIDTDLFVCVSSSGTWAIMEFSSLMPNNFSGSWNVTANVTDVTNGVIGSTSLLPSIILDSDASPASQSSIVQLSDGAVQVSFTLVRIHLTAMGTANFYSNVTLIAGTNTSAVVDEAGSKITATTVSGGIDVSLMPGEPTNATGVVTWYCAATQNGSHPSPALFATPLSSAAAVAAGRAMVSQVQVFNGAAITTTITPCSNTSDSTVVYVIGASFAYTASPSAKFSAIPSMVTFTPPAPENTNNGMIVGFVSGGIAMAVIIVGGIVYFVKRRQTGYETVN
jgi:hypothetical protein